MKLRGKKFALFTEATGVLSVSRGSKDAERLPIQVLKTQADKWTQGASMLSFSGISLKKKVRERKKRDTGWPIFFEWGPLFYF